MSPKQQREASNLFAAAGMGQDAPHPLPDRLRPRTLSDVVGQDHILGPDGALTRMLATRTLGSLIFWGPPGTGKTTAARLLADATELHFEQLSAVFSGVADLKKAFDAARARRARLLPQASARRARRRRPSAPVRRAPARRAAISCLRSVRHERTAFRSPPGRANETPARAPATTARR